MDEVLPRLLCDLAAAIQQEQASEAALEPQTIVANIFAHISSDELFQEKSARIKMLALLFDSETPPSLLKYINSTMKIKDKDILVSKREIFKKIGEMVKIIRPDEIDPFSGSIFQSAFDVICREEASDVRTAAFSPIKNILRSSSLASGLNFSLESTFSTLLDSITHDKKLSKGVKAEILKALGLLVLAFPRNQITVSYIEKVLKQAFIVLEKNFEKSGSSDPEFPVIAGSYSCLDRCLIAFPSYFSSTNLTFLWSCLLKSILVATQGELSRYEMCSKALRLLKSHAHFFRKMIALNITKVHSSMVFCSKSNNKALIKHAFDALNAVLSQFSRFVLLDGNKDAIDAMTKLVAQYSTVLFSVATAASEIDILFSVNVLSAVAPSIMVINSGPNSLAATAKIILMLIKACNFADSLPRISTESDNPLFEGMESAKVVYKKSLYLLAVVLVAQCILESSTWLGPLESDTLQEFIRNTACEIIDGYVDSSKKQKIIAKRALSCSFRLICNISGGLPYVGKPILHKLLLRAISRSLDFTDSDNALDGRLYSLYSDLLTGVLNPTDIETKQLLNFSTTTTDGFNSNCVSFLVVQQRCFDLCMDISLDIFSSFDLSYIRNSEDASYLATNIADQELYLNFASFLEKILPSSLPQRFLSNWIEIFISKVFQIILNFEMISASYRLSKLCLLVAYDRNEISSSFATTIRELVEILYLKVSNYEGELLNVVLDFLLHIPATLVEFKYALPILEVSFSSKLQCASAFKLIDQYILTENAAFFENVHKLLPLISTFLVPRGRNISTVPQLAKLRLKTKEKESLRDDYEAENIEFMAARLFGRIGGRNQKLLEERITDVSQIYWNPDTVVSLELQCSLSVKQSIDFHLENIIPVIIELSLNSSDRQTKILACELIHSLVLYMIGTTAMDPQRLSYSRFGDSYANLFPSLISLSTSTDTITREMFSKLLFQIIHWFSGQGNVNISETTTLIDALLEGTCNQSDLSLRDRCAQGLYEYFSWSIKQASPKELAESTGGIDAIISRLLNNCLSPVEGKRIGSALVFGKIYRALREEKVLVSRYSLRIMYTLYQGYRIGGQSQNELSYTIQNYMSMIYKSIKSRGDEASLLHELGSRQFPKSLKDVVIFFWDNIAHNNLSFRRLCMQGFSTLALLLLENGSLEYCSLPFVNKFYPFESSVETLHVTHIDSYISGENIEELSRDHFLRLKATLDAYNWLFKTGIIDAIKFFDNKTRSSSVNRKKQRKIEAVENDQEIVKNSNLMSVIASFLSNIDNFVGSTDNFYLSLAETFRRVLQLLSTLMELNADMFALIFKQTGIWVKVAKFIIPLILQEEIFDSATVPSSTSSKDEIDKYIPAAVFQFLRFLNFFESSDESGNFSESLRARTTSLLQNATLLDIALVSRLGTFVSFIINNSMSILAFGDNFEHFLRSISVNILKYIVLSQDYTNVQTVKRCSILLDLMLKLKCPIPDLQSYECSRVAAFIENFKDILITEVIDRARAKVDVKELKEFIFSFSNDRDIFNMIMETVLTNIQSISISDEGLAVRIVSILVPCDQLKVNIIRQVFNLCHSFKGTEKPVLVITCLSKNIISLLKASKSTSETLRDCLSCMIYILTGVMRQSPISTADDAILQTECLDGLEDLLASKFPLTSTQNLPQDSSEQYSFILKEYLKVFSTGCLPSMIDPLIPYLHEGSNHKYYTLIRNALLEFVSNFHFDDNIRNFVEISRYCSRIMFNTAHSLNTRMLIFDFIFRPIILDAPQHDIERIFSDPPSDIIVFDVKQLVERITSKPEEKSFEKTMAYSILGAVYDKCSLQCIKGSITTKYIGPGSTSTGKELTATICKSAFSLLKQQALSASSDIERLLFQTAYYCLSLIVAKTQQVEKFYDDFIFKHDYWDKVIDCLTSMSFPQKLTNPQVITLGRKGRKRVISRGRTAYFSQTQGNDDPLFLSSSLSQPFMTQKRREYSQIPIDDNIQATFIPPDDDIEMKEDEELEEVDEESPLIVGFDDVSIEIEQKDFNNQLCMESLTRVIFRMNTLFSGSWNQEIMPIWLGELCRKMVDDPDFTAAKKNIRLTILRLLLNQPVSDIVKPWLSHIIGPILQICLRDLCQGGYINYFLREIVLQFNELWSSVNLTPSLAQLSSDLFSYLFQNLYVDDAKILSMNLKAVQILLKRWLPYKFITDIDFQPILELISAEAAETGGAHGGRNSSGMESVRKRITGLEILKVVLQNNYPFIESKSEACFTEKLLKQINLSIRYPRKEVYDLASVVAGLALNYLKIHKSDVVDLFKTSINETVLAKLGLKDGADMASSCLRNVTSQFPSFLMRETFLKVHCELRRMKSRAKAEFVETITLTTSEFDGISFLHAMKPYILPFLADLTTIAIGRGRSVERFAIVQMNTLKFLTSQVARLDFSTTSAILSQGQGLDLLLTENTPINIREATFKFLMLLFNEHILGKPDIDEFSGLKRRVKLLMLRGLIDPDTEGMAVTSQDMENSDVRIGIRKQVYDFFNLRFGLSEDPICRLKDLISDLYDSSNADQWLYYAAFLLLLSFEAVNDSEKLIFTKGLADDSSFATVDFTQNTFDHYAESLDPMIPLFALERTQSQNLCVVEDDGSISVLSQVDLASTRRGYLRQTQKSSWTQTQTQGSTQHNARKAVSDAMSTQLLLGTTRFVVDSKKQKYDDSQSTSYPTTHIKQKRSVRFADDLLEESKAEAGSSSKEFQWKRPTKRRTEVPMYRKYRQGELPDLAIKLSDILKPLQGLCLRDGRIGAHVFQSSFSSIYTHLSKKMEPVAVELSLALKNMIVNASVASVSNTDFVCSIFSSALRIVTTSKEVICVKQPSTFSLEGFIPADVVSNLAITSKNIYSGIHLLEEQLCINKTLETREIKCIFLELSRLYSVLKEQDVISGISAKISPYPETQRALDFEAEGRFEDAVEVYNDIIENAVSRGLEMDAYSTDVQFWNTRSLDCQQQLLNWADLESNIQKLVLNTIEVDSLSMNFNSALMKHRSSRDNYLQKYLSCISHGEFSSTIQESFLESFSSLEDQFKPVKVWIENKCSPDLALLHARLGDWSRCRYFAEHALDQFLADWVSTSPSSTSAKRALLQNLQRIVELEDGVNLSSGTITHLECFQMWKNSRPNRSDSVNIWDDIICGRLAASQIGTQLQSREVLLEIAQLYTEAALTAIDQGVLHVVNKQLASGKSIQKRMIGHVSLSEDDVLAVFKYNMRKISREILKQTPHESILSMFQKTSSLLNGELKKRPNSPQLLVMKGDLHLEWAKFEKLENELFVLQYQDSFNSYHEAVQVLSPLELASGCGDIYAKFALFCSNILDGRSCSDTSGDGASDTEDEDDAEYAPSKKQKLQKIACQDISSDDIALYAVNAFVEGLKFGDKTCRESLLRLLDITGRHQSTIQRFASDLDNIPAWYFMRYIPQLLGRLDKPEYVLVCCILKKLAEKYPKTVYYPFKVSMPCLSSKAFKRIECVSDSLVDNSYEQFIEALSGLTHPHLRYKDLLKEIRIEFNAKNLERAKELMNALKRETMETNWSAVGSQIGSYNLKFAKLLSKSFEKEKVLMDGKISQAVIDSLSSRDLIEELTYGKVPLSAFSQWLSTFDSSIHRIEIPGMFKNTNREPTAEIFDYIMNVDQFLLVMSSIRKPKRIIFYGTSGKEYRFLVKGGEDLRTDERIQQLFELMNEVVGPVTGGLSARTYTVVPMTLKLGVLEWVPNTVPLRQLICDEMSKDADFKSANAVAFNKAHDVHFPKLKGSTERLAWIPWKEAKEISSAYHLNYIKKGISEACTIWESVQRKIPQDFLRRRFASMSHSTESFFAYRKEFMKSFSVSSIYGYICGIGDRHLDNVLIDTKTGSVVQIDFDMCFGKGSILLGVPELIPFRLTPQILSVLEPLEGSIHLRPYMLDVLSALRRIVSVQKLANALDIYLNDPINDWVNTSKEREDIEKKSKEDWEPKRRIENTLRKLRGIHPVYMLIKDLSKNNTVRSLKSLNALKDILLSVTDPGSKVIDGDVAKMEHVVLSTGDQIDCLLKLASHPNILIRQWEGLNLWI